MTGRFDALYRLVMEQTGQNDGFRYRDMTVAIVPGSFKPPNKGHREMVMAYVGMADKVIVLISNISKAAISSRPLSLTNLKELRQAEGRDREAEAQGGRRLAQDRGGLQDSLRPGGQGRFADVR